MAVIAFGCATPEFGVSTFPILKSRLPSDYHFRFLPVIRSRPWWTFIVCPGRDPYPVIQDQARRDLLWRYCFFYFFFIFFFLWCCAIGTKRFVPENNNYGCGIISISPSAVFDFWGPPFFTYIFFSL